MRLHIAVAFLVGCGSANGLDVVGDPPRDIPVICQPPAFPEGACRADILNDGTGPDDHRTVCVDGLDTWILYPSGEIWRYRAPDGKSDPVLCHLLPDGGGYHH